MLVNAVVDLSSEHSFFCRVVHSVSDLVELRLFPSVYRAYYVNPENT